MAASRLTDKTLDVLEAVASAGSASLPQVQARCGLPTTTVHRIMLTLVERRFLMRAGKGEYRLGSAAIMLSEGASCRDLLAPAARPHLRKLSRQVRTHVHLGVWQDGMVAYLVKRRYGKGKVHSAEGTQLEGYCSALGKVLLAGLENSEFDRYAADGAFLPLTGNTIVDPDALRREIAQVRARGWARDDEEMALGLRCIAVPVHDDRGDVAAAISISALGDGATPDRLTELLRALTEAADMISQQVFPRPSIR